MITTEKLQKMIEKFGATELDKLYSWFPKNSEEDIKDIISQSESLLFDNGVVSFKRSSTNIEDDISYDGVLQIINKYNKKTKVDFERKNVGRTDHLKIEAIKTFLLEKYTLELFEHFEAANIYIQTNKNTGYETYCVICKTFNETVFNYLDNLFKEESVIIYYINLDYSMETIKDFYLRDCNEIIKRYIKSYQLEEMSVNILKIAEKIGDDNYGK